MFFSSPRSVFIVLLLSFISQGTQAVIAASPPGRLNSSALPGGRTLHVAQKPGADDNNPGTQQAPLKTINRAAQLAEPGDTVLVHAGLYREWVRPARGGTGPDRMITYQAAEGEKVVIRGSKVFDPAWEPLTVNGRKNENLVRAAIPEALFEINPRLKGPGDKKIIYNPFNTPVHVSWYDDPKTRFAGRKTTQGGLGPLVVGEVYTKGLPLRQVRGVAEVWATAGTWCVLNEGKTLVVHFMSFTRRAVELTVRHQVFAPELRGLGYIRVKGFIIEQAANQGPFPQAGMVSTRSGHHWIIENNVIRHAATIGVDVGSEVEAHWGYLPKQDINEGAWADPKCRPIYETRLPPGPWPEGYNIINAPAPAKGHIVRNNLICDNGLSGIAAIIADDLVIEGNVIEGNNRRNLDEGENPDVHWEETAGIKLHLTRNALIRHNLVRNQPGAGRGIWLDNNNDNARISGNLVLNNLFGIDLEINASPGILVDNNIVAFNRIDGLSSRDSVTCRFVHNLSMYNGRWGCIIAHTGTRGNYFHRQFTRPVNCEVRNNVFFGNQEGAIRLPMPKDETERQGHRVDGNLIGEGQGFQLCPGGPKGLSPEQMISLTQGWLAEARISRDRWPNLDFWRQADWWFRGQCDFTVFQAVWKGAGNGVLKMPAPLLWALSDQFTDRNPTHYPIEGYRIPQLSPRYAIRIVPEGRWKDVRVDRVADIREDYFSAPAAGEKVRPGPFQAESEDHHSVCREVWPSPFHKIPGREGRGGGENFFDIASGPN
jgi:hypothetical protein